MIQKRLAISFLSIFFTLTLQGQSFEKKELTISGLEHIVFEHNAFVNDSLSALNEKNKILQQLYSQSFLAASFDSMRLSNNSIQLYFTSGNKYEWLNLSNGNLSAADRLSIDLNDRLFLNRPFNKKQLLNLFERTINHYENNGYPFASVRLDSVSINEENQISAALNVQRGQFYQFDSLDIRGDVNVSEQFILHSLGLKRGMPYPENKIKQIAKNIREIPFLEEERKHEVQFFETSSVKLILNLKKKKASRFDGIVGLMTDETDGSISVTGDVDLQLLNAFNRGEKMSFQWKKLKESSQELNLDFGIPYLFNSPFGFDFNFQLYKEDTTFLDLSSRFGVNYIFNGEENIHFFYENRRSSLLSRDRFTNSSSQLPPFSDLRINQFGISYQIQRLNYRYNPQRGFVIQPTFAVGKKKIEKIAALVERNPNIYDGIEKSSSQYDGSLIAKYFIPLGKRSTILIGNRSAITYSDVLYTNELLRLGGLKTLRGFDENSIRASSYAIFTLEYRFLLDRNSFLSIFSDGGYYEKNDMQSYVKDTPFGVGAGINFETAAGIFSFNYAVGKQFDNPIELRAAKIHFGYTSIF